MHGNNWNRRRYSGYRYVILNPIVRTNANCTKLNEIIAMFGGNINVSGQSDDFCAKLLSNILAILNTDIKDCDKLNSVIRMLGGNTIDYKCEVKIELIKLIIKR